MKILTAHEKYRIRAAVFDFDGTLSTLRCGWESVMAPLMEEIIADGPATEDVRTRVRDYIDASTGIQTILQMKWLAGQVRASGRTPLDPWEYKAEYNRRLMQNVQEKREAAQNGARERCLMKGAEAFLAALKSRGIKLYAASGTDEADVRLEAAALGLDGYFESIEGAKPLLEDCSKEATLRRLMEEQGTAGGLLVVGDGPVEIRLGRECGALTLGIAGDETQRCGYSDAKIRRLTDAGAHALVDCFEPLQEILDWMED